MKVNHWAGETVFCATGCQVEDSPASQTVEAKTTWSAHTVNEAYGACHIMALATFHRTRGAGAPTKKKAISSTFGRDHGPSGSRVSTSGSEHNFNLEHPRGQWQRQKRRTGFSVHLSVQLFAGKECSTRTIFFCGNEERMPPRHARG